MANHPESNKAPRHILTILAVADLEKSSEFYRQAFGWKNPVKAPVYTEFELPGGQKLGLYQRENFAHNTNKMPESVAKGSITSTEIYLHVEDLKEAIKKIEAAGAIKLSELADRDWGDKAAYYADLDGNVLVIAKPIDKS